MDLFIVIPLMLYAMKCLDRIDCRPAPDELETLRSTLILATVGLYKQRKNHYLADALYRVVRGRMRPEEATLLTTCADLEDDTLAQALRQQVRSAWPVSVVKSHEDVDAHRLANMVKNLNV